MQQHVLGLQQQLQDLALKTEQERAAHETYARSVEDRAYREIDRAREESKGRATQVKEVTRQQAELQRQLKTMQASLSEAQQKAAAQQARADTLAQQLAQQRPAMPATKAKAPKRASTTPKLPK
ncbi:hypothetical protein D3C85_1490750 [compost metagenome]